MPGAGSAALLLGLVESYGIAVFGTSYRNLFAFLLLIVSSCCAERPVRRARQAAARAAHRHLHRAEPPGAHSALGAAGRRLACSRLLPLFRCRNGYVLQTLINAWLLAMLALSLTLVAGTVGQVSLGQAALLAIGAYTSGAAVAQLQPSRSASPSSPAA